MDIAKRVGEIVAECQSLAGVEVDGIDRTYIFSGLDRYREEIRGLLNRMPAGFHRDSGGGSSLMNLCSDRDGVTWGRLADTKALVALGIGVGMAGYSLPKSVWATLPGGLPLVVFNTK